MSKIGVFVTTHVSPGNYRHGNNFDIKVFNRIKDVIIPNYTTKYYAGDNVDVDLYIMDTQSSNVKFIEYISNISKEIPNVHHVIIPNKCGVFASMTTLMFGNFLPNDLDYFFFHPDDHTYVEGDCWGTNIINEFKYKLPIGGILGKKKTTIKLSKNGLVDHNNICSHVADMWNITNTTVIPHIEGDFHIMDLKSLNKLKEHWYAFDPNLDDNGTVKKAINYQYNLEQTDYVELALRGDGRKKLDDMHIGRETDFALRIAFAGINYASYEGNNIIIKRC